MATQKIPGRGLWLPAFLPPANMPPAFNSGLVIDASTEKAAMIGRFFHKGGATINVNKVGFRFGTVAVNVLSDIQVSLQNLNATDAFPDETADQSANVGNANITSNTWREITLGASRSTAPGDLLAVVWEYSTFVALDSVVISALGLSSSAADDNQCYVALKSGGGPTWGVNAGVLPNVVLGCDDGTYGTLDGAYPISALNAHTYNSGTGSADEYALIWNAPFPVVVDAAWVLCDLDGDANIILYDGTTAMTNGTVTADKDNRVSTSARRLVVPFGGHITLSANHDYYLAVQPSSATNLSAYSFDVGTAAYMQAIDGGTPMQYTTRLDAGSWAAATATRRLWAGLRVIGCDDAVGGSGGGLRLAGHGGLAG